MLSLERFTAIREINTRHQYAVVEAGVLNDGLGRAAAAAGMFYPPDPGSFVLWNPSRRWRPRSAALPWGGPPRPSIR